MAGEARIGMQWLGGAVPAWLGMAWQVRRGAARRGMVCRGLAWQARQGPVRRRQATSGNVRQARTGVEWIGGARRGKARQGRQGRHGRLGLARSGKVRSVAVRLGKSRQAR